MPFTSTEAFSSCLLVEFAPEKVAPCAMVSFPVPSLPDVAIHNSPSLMVVVPVLVLAPDQVILPVPNLTRFELEVTFTEQPQLASFPTCHVLAPTLVPLLNVQPPPRAPLPVSLPIRKVLPLFCTSTFDAMFIVPFGIPLLVLSVKRSTLGSSRLEVGIRVPSKLEKSHCTGVRVA